MEFFIAGGNGFIGSNLVANLLRRYPDSGVYNLDLYENRELLRMMDVEDQKERYTFVEGNVMDPDTYEDYLKLSDVVITCAFENNRELFQEKMHRFINTNILGSRILADVTGRYEIPMIMISTDEVYGSCPETIPRRDENAPMMPTNPYATTMAAAESLCSQSRKMYNSPLVILRPCMLVGPNQGKRRLIPGTIKSVMDGKPPKVMGKRDKHYRDWLHVYDLCSAVDLVIKGMTGRGLTHDSPAKVGMDGHNMTVISGTEVATVPPKKMDKKTSPEQLIAGGAVSFNVTGEMRYPIYTIVELILKEMGSELPIQEKEHSIYRDIGYNPSGRKLSYQGWSPKYNEIDGILRSTIEWYREHPEALEMVSTGQLKP